jgi:hypothetical protein
MHPERIINNMINDYVSGELDDNTFLYRAIAVKIDQIGGQLEGKAAKVNPDSNNISPNPKNSIQARVVSNGHDRATDDSNLAIFWPLFPYDVMPVKEGEHIYVIFEDNATKTHGLWLTRIPENSNVDNTNLVLGSDKYNKELRNWQSQRF